MGLLSTLFGIVPMEQPPQLSSIFPPAAALRIQSRILPTVKADRLILAYGETCHFIDVCALVTQKKRRQSAYTGGSYNMGKGFTLHTGRSQSTPIVEPHYTKGVLYITNLRIIFAARENGFDQKISKLTSITPYSDGICLQFGNKSYSILLPDVQTARQALNLLL